jgi:hypothetical protein
MYSYVWSLSLQGGTQGSDGPSGPTGPTGPAIVQSFEGFSVYLEQDNIDPPFAPIGGWTIDVASPYNPSPGIFYNTGNFDLTSGVYTASQDGHYQINANLFCGEITYSVYVNNVSRIQFPGSIAGTISQLADTILLQEGDTVNLQSTLDPPQSDIILQLDTDGDDPCIGTFFSINLVEGVMGNTGPTGPTGATIIPSFEGFSVYLEQDVIDPSASTPIGPWTIEVASPYNPSPGVFYNTGNFNLNGAYTAPETGNYLINTNLTSNGITSYGVFVNGVGILQFPYTNSDILQLSETLLLQAGDIVSLESTTNSPPPDTISQLNNNEDDTVIATWFSINLILVLQVQQDLNQL